MEFKQIHLKEKGELGATVEWGEIQETNAASAFPYVEKKDHSLPTHNDFAKAVNMLIPIVPKLDRYPSEESNLIEVTGVIFKYKKRMKGVVICYRREGFDKKFKTDWVEINTEEVLFDCQPELNEALENIILEAYAYLFEGKHFDSEQGAINFADK